MITNSQIITSRLLLEWCLYQRNRNSDSPAPLQTYWINLHFNMIPRGFQCTLKFESISWEQIYSLPPPKPCFVNDYCSHSHLPSLSTLGLPHTVLTAKKPSRLSASPLLQDTIRHPNSSLFLSSMSASPDSFNSKIHPQTYSFLFSLTLPNLVGTTVISHLNHKGLITGLPTSSCTVLPHILKIPRVKYF